MLLEILKALYGPACFAFGYYVCKEGFSGVYTDLKSDISYIKSKIEPNEPATTTIVPVPVTPAA